MVSSVPAQAGLPAVGWRESVDLPDLGFSGLAAKIDTGARTSSLHALEARCFEQGGKQWVRFLFDLGQGLEPRECTAPHVERRPVTSSNGETQERLVIKTTLGIGHTVFRTEFTLADRSEMAYPILVGRMALRRRFIVDAGRSWLHSTKP